MLKNINKYWAENDAGENNMIICESKNEKSLFIIVITNCLKTSTTTY